MRSILIMNEEIRIKVAVEKSFSNTHEAILSTRTNISFKKNV